jgi:hypothetical protein
MLLILELFLFLVDAEIKEAYMDDNASTFEDEVLVWWHEREQRRK